MLGSDKGGTKMEKSKQPIIQNSLRKEKFFSPHKMTLMALFSVLCYLLMLIRFPLPFMPPFMDFDLAGVPELIGTFLLGPVEGVIIILIKILLKTVTLGSSSAFTGEVMNFILSCAFVLPAWFIYNLKRDKRHAVLGMITGTAVTTIFACFLNIYLIIPVYAKLFGFNMEAVIEMTKAVNPYIDSVSMLVILGIVPFNIIKNGVASVIVLLLYKRVLRVLERILHNNGVRRKG